MLDKDPAVDRAVVYFEAALLEHFFQVAIAQRVAQIPSHRLHDQSRFEMSPLEIVFQLALQPFGNQICETQIAANGPNPMAALGRANYARGALWIICERGMDYLPIDPCNTVRIDTPLD